MSARVSSPALIGGRVLVPVLILAAWAGAAALTDEIAPLGASFDAVLGGYATGTLPSDTLDTLGGVLAGFALAALVGVPLGVSLGRSPYWHRVIEPLFSGTAAVPRIVLFPILLTVLGITVEAKAAMAFLAALVPIALTAMAGARTVSPTLLKLGRSLEMSRRAMLFKVVIPSARAPVVSGLRIGFSLALLTVILTEFFAATAGIGMRIQAAYSVQDLPLMYGLVALVVVFGLAANIGLWTLERRAQ